MQAAAAQGPTRPITTDPRLPSRAPAPAEAEAVLSAVNRVRAERRLPSLTLDPRLSEAAAVQARYLARTRRLDHRGPDGSRVAQRVDRAGYRWSTVAENLAQARTASARLVVDMWMHSRGHRENLLNRQVTQVGTAHVGDVWVLVLARPR